MVAQQAIIDAYIWLLHLTIGILVGEYRDLFVYDLFSNCSIVTFAFYGRN
jgi:hypothetical protein